MQRQTLQDGTESFTVSVHKAARISPVVLFAVGAGGQPERHDTLLDALVFCLSRKWTFRPPAVSNYHVRLGT